MTASLVVLDPELRARRIRMLAFVAMLASVAVMGVLSEAFPDPIVSLPWCALVFLPAWLLWVVADCRVREVRGWRAVAEVLLAFAWSQGLLYFVWTRRFRGLVEWLAFWIALVIPFWLTSILAHGVFQIARGQRW